MMVHSCKQHSMEEDYLWKRESGKFCDVGHTGEEEIPTHKTIPMYQEHFLPHYTTLLP